jgi:hypothetical protein
VGNPDNEPQGTGEAGHDDPTRDHWLEPGAPAEVADAIARHATEVQEKLSVVGTGGLDCLSTRDAWADVFEGESIQFRQLGHTVDKYRGRDPGGYLVPGEVKPRDHHWLAVGPCLTLFDPTWGRYFRELGPPSLDRYITDDGRPFEEWRRDEARRATAVRTEMIERDIRDVLRERPITVPQVFAPNDRVNLLCPPGTDAGTFERAVIAFGPFSASVLGGVVRVSVPARMDEAQDLWSLVMKEAMPGDEQREPEGEPLPTIRTATLGWRLLALLGGSIELLACTSAAVQAWRNSGQPTGFGCTLGESLLTFQTQGAEATARHLDSFSRPEAGAALLGYPSEAVLGRHIAPDDAALIHSRCERSAAQIASVFAVAASTVADPFWRTFMKWKHGAIGTSPGASPVWIKNSPDLDRTALEVRLNSGIVVFDAQGGPKMYIWPAQRVDLMAYSTITVHVLQLAETIIRSVLNYALPRDAWPLAIIEFDPAMVPAQAECDAFDRLAASAYRVAALTGSWREPAA